MKKVIPLLIIGVFIFLHSINNSYAQYDQSGVQFVFDSKDKLISTLESDSKKEILFEISGIGSGKQADALQRIFLSATDRVSDCKIIHKKNATCTGSLSLTAETKTSHFTKLLITCGIREIVVEGTRIRSEELNDK